MPTTTPRTARHGRQRRARRGFGAIRKLPSKRFQASYIGPDGRRHLAPFTFDARKDAEAWLAEAQTDMSRGDWERPAPKRKPVDTLAAYAEAWLATRGLRDRTRVEYRKLLGGHLYPAFGPLTLTEITPVMVRDWYSHLTNTTGPTRRAHAYGLLRAILNTAVADDLIPANPCRVRGGGQSKRARQIRPATLAELEVIAEEMPAGYRAAVLLAAWCGLRFGELAELRRKDIDVRAKVVHVSRAVTFVDGKPMIGAPKSDAGVRDVAVPPHLVPMLREHLAAHVAVGAEALLFPSPSGTHLRSDGALHRAFHAARLAANRPDLRFHDLRHTGATLAAAGGATLAELMRRLGHSTSVAAMRYQHATSDRDAAIAAALSEFHTAKVVALRPETATRNLLTR
jgi:integrase